MLMSFIAPYLSYVIGVGALAIFGSFLYIKRLRSLNAQLKNELTALKTAYEENLVQLQQYKTAYERYLKEYEERVAADAAAAATKAEKLAEAKTIEVNDSDSLTQAEIDSINKVKAKKGKK